MSVTLRSPLSMPTNVVMPLIEPAEALRGIASLKRTLKHATMPASGDAKRESPWLHSNSTRGALFLRRFRWARQPRLFPGESKIRSCPETRLWETRSLVPSRS
jgi:hypothetical protein